MNKIRIAVGCIPLVLLSIFVSSAGAVVFSPPAIDFGRQPAYTISPPRTLTVTKDPTLRTESITLEIVESDLGSFKSTSNCPDFLTVAAPSCTITISYTPFKAGRTDTATIDTGGSGFSAPGTIATISGTGTKPCLKKKQTHKTVQVKRICRGFHRIP